MTIHPAHQQPDIESSEGPPGPWDFKSDIFCVSARIRGMKSIVSAETLFKQPLEEGCLVYTGSRLDH
jgi:hypothetical protein